MSDGRMGEPSICRGAGQFGTLDRECRRTFPHAGYLLRGLGRAPGARGGDRDFDSAAALLDRAEARLLAAEWRVIPRALGIPLGTADEQAGRQARQLRRDPALGTRAAWALAMDAFAAGDVAPGAAGLTDGGPCARQFLRAMEEAGRTDTPKLLDIGAALAMQTVAVPLGDPETVGYSGGSVRASRAPPERGEWYAALGDSLAAEREWGWYEAVDIDGLPTVELPQPGEIDWALGNYGRYLRGMIALRTATGNRPVAISAAWPNFGPSPTLNSGAPAPGSSRRGRACGRGTER